MKENQLFGIAKNKHTGKVLQIIKREEVKDGEEIIVVFTLSDGGKWSEEYLYKHWDVTFVN